MPRPLAVLAAVAAVGLLVAGVALVRPIAASASVPGAEDGYVDAAHPISPFSDLPAVARLTPQLRSALQSAARDAEVDGIAMVVTSGWRDQRYQDWLYAQAVSRDGQREASEYVAAGSSSRHLTGEAVDVGPTDADSWMQQHGSRYGLCQIYANEMWHYELATTPGGACPSQYRNASARP